VTESQPVVMPVALPEFSTKENQGAAVHPLRSIAEVKLAVSVVAGHTTMSLSQVRDLKAGDVIRLDRAPDATVDVYINGTLAAIGDVVVIDDHIAARIGEVLSRGVGNG
jgi:flagellar motor switch protein FliN/FliY